MGTLKGWSRTYNTIEMAGAVASAFSLLCERFYACLVSEYPEA